MVDARQILQPRFTYVLETDARTRIGAVILGHANTKEALRISQGIIQHIPDLDVYKSENDKLRYEHVKDLYGIMGLVKRDQREYLLLIEE